MTEYAMGDNLLLPETNYSDLLNMDSFPDNLCVLSHTFFNEEKYKDAFINGSWGDDSEVSFDVPIEDIFLSNTICVIADVNLIKIENEQYRDKYPLTFNEFSTCLKNIPNGCIVLWNLKYVTLSQIYKEEKAIEMYGYLDDTKLIVDREELFYSPRVYFKSNELIPKYLLTTDQLTKLKDKFPDCDRIPKVSVLGT